MGSRTEKMLRKSVKILKESISNLHLLYLFGSHASGDSTDQSDLDLAFLSDHPLDSLERFNLQEKLASELGMDVDLVDLKQADTVFKTEIISKGRIIYQSAKAKKGQIPERFEMEVLSSYARLNEERAGILQDIAERGSVHEIHDE